MRRYAFAVCDTWLLITFLKQLGSRLYMLPVGYDETLCYVVHTYSNPWVPFLDAS